VEERRKMERETGPPFNPVLHPPLRVRQWLVDTYRIGRLTLS
jgi:hypothetical protein